MEDLGPPDGGASDGVDEKMEALLEDSAVDRELSRGQGILADKPGASAANPGTEEEVI